jgi:putative peptide maturation system protein
MRSDLRSLQDELRRGRPALRLNLVAHEEPFDGSVAHDVVVRDGTRVLVVGMSAPSRLPWPLRGVTRAGEQRLLRVNGQKLDVADALACLDFLFDDREALRTLIRSCVVAEALEEEPVELSADQMQAAADAFRRGKGLLTAEQTERWKAERAMSDGEFETLVRRTATVAALRRRVAGPEEVHRHFERHRDRYATVLVAFAPGGPEVLSGDVLAAVTRERGAGRVAGITEWRVADLPPGMAAVGDTAVGSAVAVRIDDVDGTAVVLDRRNALDPATADRISRELFDEWLDQRRRAADVEWHWGDALRTNRVG